jgi:hypothetical protein
MIIPKPLTYNQWKFRENHIILFDNIMFPLISRVAARAIGLDLVTVQPMPAPNFIDYFGDNPIENDIIKNIKKPVSYSSWRRVKNVFDDLQNGIIFSPYIPLMVTPQIIGGDTIPRQNIATRYANRIVNNSYYGRINID